MVLNYINYVNFLRRYRKYDGRTHPYDFTKITFYELTVIPMFCFCL